VLLYVFRKSACSKTSVRSRQSRPTSTLLKDMTDRTSCNVDGCERSNRPSLQAWKTDRIRRCWRETATWRRCFVACVIFATYSTSIALAAAAAAPAAAAAAAEAVEAGFSMQKCAAYRRIGHGSKHPLGVVGSFWRANVVNALLIILAPVVPNRLRPQPCQ